MTKIEEIIEKNRNKTDHYADQDFSDFGNISVEFAMKEYAEFYARKVLEIAANEAYAGIRNYDQPYVKKHSVLNIKLPEHE